MSSPSSPTPHSLSYSPETTISEKHPLEPRPCGGSRLLISVRRTSSQAGLLLAAVIAIELTLVGINVLLNQWNNRFYTALQEKNWEGFVREMGIFCILATAYIALAVYQLYLNQWLQIRWRKLADPRTISANGWMVPIITACSFTAMRPTIRTSASPTMSRCSSTRRSNIGVGLLSAVVTLGSFIVILWGLSAGSPLTLFGSEFHIPGYLVWGALIYATFGTVLTHWIGSPLVMLNFLAAAF